MTQRLWFTQTVEGLFIRGLGEQLTPAAREAVKNAGIDLTKKLEVAYPAEVVEAACRAVLPFVFPGVSDDEGFFQLGRTFMRGYSSTLIGSAMVGVMKVIGARRSLERMTKNFRTGGNYIETKVTVHGPTSVELWFNDVGQMPGFYRGVIVGGGELIGVSAMRVEQKLLEPPTASFHVTWSA
ncbi:MAG: DUF2378 family protein [Archangium sp.]